MNVGIEDYGFEDKNRWRVRVWHRIAAKVKRYRDPQKALAVYLPGPQNLDYPVAVRKGFLPTNLVAVDFDKEIVAALRARGVLAIHNDFLDVVQSWKYKDPLSVIYGDFCSGLEMKLAGRIQTALISAHIAEGCVIAFNFQRGRDASSNVVRSLCEYEKDCGEVGHAPTVALQNGFSYEAGAFYKALRTVCNVDLVLHRGAQFVYEMFRQNMVGFARDAADQFNGAEESPQQVALRDVLSYKPEFLSYKGRRVIMDSVILQVPSLLSCEDRPYGGLVDCDVQRLIAACMAHRTMRARA